MERLRQTANAQPELTVRLGALPMFLLARVGAARIAIVHGDADALAGWGLSQETLATPAGLAAARAGFEAAGANVIASSHTCLPVLQRIEVTAGDALLLNTGSTGMPNFHAERYGLATRISVHPSGMRTRYGARANGVHVYAIPVEYDTLA